MTIVERILLILAGLYLVFILIAGTIYIDGANSVIEYVARKQKIWNITYISGFIGYITFSLYYYIRRKQSSKSNKQHGDSKDNIENNNSDENEK